MNPIKALRDKLRRDNDARRRAHKEYWAPKRCSALVKKDQRVTAPCGAAAPVEVGGKMYCKHHVPIRARRTK